MADTEKIEYGLSSIFFAPLTSTFGSDGTETHTYGKPIALKGAKSLSKSPEGDQTSIYADDTKYYTVTNNNGYSGDLGFIYFSDDIRKTIFKHQEASNGMLIERSDVEPVEGALLFECKGDKNKIRHILYNVKFGNPSQDYATKEDGVEPTEVTIPFVSSPIRLTTGEMILSGKCRASDAGYATFFNSVTVPTFTTGE